MSIHNTREVAVRRDYLHAASKAMDAIADLIEREGKPLTIAMVIEALIHADIVVTDGCDGLYLSSEFCRAREHIDTTLHRDFRATVGAYIAEMEQ